MKAKTKKSIIIIILLIISSIIGWPIERAKVTYSIDKYRAYYLIAKNKKSFLQLGDGITGYTVIYFLPGQKQQMLKRIKDDVNNSLKKLIDDHTNIFYKYEISDDFTKVYIYKTSSDEQYSLRTMMNVSINHLIGLYHEVKGHRRENNGKIINIIEPIK